MPDNNITHWTEDDDLLGQYILGRLPEEEERRLEAHLAVCSQCRLAVQYEKELAAGIRLFGRDQISARLRQRLTERAERSRRILTWQRILSAAAVLVIIGGIGIYNRWFSWDESKSLLTTEESQESKKKPGVTDNETSQSSAKESGTEPGKVESRPLLDQKPRDEANAAGASTAQSEKTKGLPQVSAGENAGNKDDHLFAVPSPGGGVVSQNKDLETTQPQANAPFPGPSQFWTEGRFLLASTTADQGFQAMEKKSKADRKAVQAERNEDKSARLLTDAKTARAQQIELSQRRIDFLPSTRQKLQHDNTQSIQTFVQQSEKGTTMTMYLDTLFDENGLQNAKVETIRPDSIVIEIKSRKIGFKLPFDLQSREQGARKAKMK